MVTSLDQMARRIFCKKTDTVLRTQGKEVVKIKILEEDEPFAFTPSLHNVGLSSGKVKVTTSVDQYFVYEVKSLKQCSKRTCGYKTYDLNVTRCPKCDSPMRFHQEEEFIEKKDINETPPLRTELETHAAWLDISIDMKALFEKEFWPRWKEPSRDKSQDAPEIPSFGHAVHSVLHALLKAFPERLRCDHDEIAGAYGLINQGNTEARVYIYDNFPGGLGLADEFAEDPHPLLEQALEIIERCTCTDDSGCPVCLARFGCKEFNDNLSKLAGRFLLRSMLGMDTKDVIYELKSYVDRLPPSLQVLTPPADISSDDDLPF